LQVFSNEKNINFFLKNFKNINFLKNFRKYRFENRIKIEKLEKIWILNKTNFLIYKNIDCLKRKFVNPNFPKKWIFTQNIFDSIFFFNFSKAICDFFCKKQIDVFARYFFSKMCRKIKQISRYPK